MGERLNGKTGEYLRWGLSLVLAGLVSYAAMQSRVAVLENDVATLKEYMREIRADVKTLINRP